MTYQIKIPVFEGPFDLLLFFIERDEVEIQDISITKITEDFLDYIHQMNALNIEVASEFIFFASSLMQIKVKTLLPRIFNEENAENTTDPRLDLIQKLIEYKKFKAVSEELKILEETRSLHYKRGNITSDLVQISQSSELGEELSSFDLYKLMNVYLRTLNKYKNRENIVTHTVVQYPYSIEEQKENISKLLAINKQLDFDTLCQLSENKIHFVYKFLAILEMLQQELIEIQIHLGFNNFLVLSKDES